MKSSNSVAATGKNFFLVISFTGIFSYVEKIFFDTIEHSDYHGHILIVYVFFDLGGKRLE
ncbi:MAG: hypothetical protein KJO60_02320 [Desulfofustis sp.]|nr:hypothetical protein [Desulfofustis sp.]NNF47351.1 hypothetical protein [Desulfofustis sp.]